MRLDPPPPSQISMPEPLANAAIGAPPESPHAVQLKRGFPRLRFEPALEAEFKQVHLKESLHQVRRNLWLAIAFVVGFSALAHLVLNSDANRMMDVIRVAVFTPVLTIALWVVHSRFYHRYYPIVCLLGSTLFGIGVVVLDVIAAQHSVNFNATVVIAIIYIYFMLGMTFYAALFAATTVLISYVIAGVLASLPISWMVIDVGVLAFTNLVGAMVCYSLERTHRTNFLEERLLIEAASRDGLTGIHNRRSFDEHVDRLWPQAIRDQAPLALLLVDIDHFKAYNDYYGHQAGDECLRQVAWTLTNCARRPLDITARYGGEEFAIVLYDARRDHVEEAVRRIQSGIEKLSIKHTAPGISSKTLTVSIGGACIQPANGRSHFGFIQLADEALYAAKSRGRNCAVIMDKEYDQLSTGSFRKSLGSESTIGLAS
jgi:diguanylate cyclase (GGDEF)-like protein